MSPGRIAIGVEYDGSHYHGWQRQKHDDLTVQQVVEQALSKVANHPVELVCAGRTDAGVHATQQIAHFDTHAVRSEKSWAFGANTNMPFDIAVKWARNVAEDFHARYTAQARSYRYLIYNSPVRQGLLASQITWNYRPLNVERMDEAAQSLIGEHDFTSYRAVACQAKHALRTMERISVRRVGDVVVLDLTANAFLQHMVRNITGVLMAIGCGERPVTWCEEVLQAQDRTKAGVTAPPFGLYFVGVRYPKSYQLPDNVYKIPTFPLL
jgi:tRNA pseudouridine38-40 synthase